jgi:hypothetical protein
MLPVGRAASLDLESAVDAAVADRGQVERHDRAGAAGAAGLGGEVAARERVPELARLDVELRATPNGRAPTLELVDRQIDALAAERDQRSLESLRRDQPGEIAGLAAGQIEQAPVRARGMAVDALPDQLEEVSMAAL